MADRPKVVGLGGSASNAVGMTHPEPIIWKGDSVTTCTHIDQIRDVTPEANGCIECLAIGDEWVHLRLCTPCGHVGCCDSSKGKHATAHATAT